MKIKWIIVVLVLLINSALYATENGELTKDKLKTAIDAFNAQNDKVCTNPDINKDDKCKKYPSDPFELGATVISGEDKGKCLDTSQFRPVKILSDSEAKKHGFTPNKDKVVIANFNHMNNFYLAQIPVKNVKDMVFQVEPFGDDSSPVRMGHAQTRFIFNEPIILKRQDGSSSKTTKLSELILSIHATGAQDDYEPFSKGIDGSYSSSLAVFSTPTKIKAYIKNGRKVEQHRLDASDEEKTGYLVNYFEKSQEWGLAKRYHTVANNCGSGQFGVIDDALILSSSEKNQSKTCGAVVGQYNPGMVSGALKARGLIKDSSNRMKNMEDDPSVKNLYSALKAD